MGALEPFGMLPGTVIWILIIAVAVAFFSRVFRRHIVVFGPTLVLRRFDLNESPRDGVFLRVVGRRSGLISWLLTLLRLETESALEVNRERFLVRRASLYGESHEVIPLTGIASINCGYDKPFHLLLIAAILLLVGLVTALGTLGESRRVAEGIGLSVAVLFGFALPAGIFVVWYWLSRRLVIGVLSRGGDHHGLAFKPSVIENVSVDLKRALQAMALIHRKVLEAQPAPAAGTTSAAASRPKPGVCAQCGSSLAPEERFCGYCGASVIQ